jgi:predicted CXXCH cytochrome family protein
VRRLTLLLAGGAVWLFLAAIPVFADGGPHIASINNGSGGINADSCAGCHRAHTAQGAMLLIEEDGPAFCLVCHGAAGVGATTDVETGQQYTPTGTSGTGRGAALGALRNGGFVQARIGSGAAYRTSYQRVDSVTGLPVFENGAPAWSNLAKVPVSATAGNVTSVHGGTGPAWGNGTAAGLGAEVDVECTTCHNPHGNGNYRILNPMPISSTAGGFVPPAAGIAVKDDTTNSGTGAQVRNYTVIQLYPPANSLLASQVTSYGATAGDYFHRRVPWNATATGTNGPDAPNGDNSGTDQFNYQINAWCATCHTRLTTTTSTGTSIVTYPTGEGSFNNSTGTSFPFTYRHPTSSNKPCTTCHVAHGSNAQMTGAYSSAFEVVPGDATTISNSSFLLKIDNRGSCQACHIPTSPLTLPPPAGPVPNPIVP